MKKTILYSLCILCLSVSMQETAFAAGKQKPKNDMSKKKKGVPVASTNARKYTDKYAQQKKH